MMNMNFAAVGCTQMSTLSLSLCRREADTSGPQEAKQNIPVFGEHLPEIPVTCE